jgi:uncharacterized membrane protein HdeD (DUF308 family)
MHALLARNWWALALRGVLAILFGLIALLMPGITLAVLVMLFGVYALIDGIFACIAAARTHDRAERGGALLIEGALGIIIGLLALVYPISTAMAVIYLVAAWAVVTGILEIAAAVHLRRAIEGEWVLGLIGVISVLLGLLLFAVPGAGLLVWIWMIGAYALVFGVLLLALALRLRNTAHDVGARPQAHGV